MGDYRVTEFLMKRTSVKQPFHKIIHLHGGKITASSQNETIDFVITLPLSA